MSEQPKILYVEDDPDIRMVAEMALEDEFEIYECESGKIALETAAGIIPDLLLLDVMMPEMDGPTTLGKLRELEGYANIPVIFMTAKVQSQEVESYLALGAVGIISKPFDPMALGEKIRELLK